MRLKSFTLPLGISAFLPLALPGQVARSASIPDTVTCRQCRIELTLVVSLGGSSEAEGLIDVASRFARDSDGRFYVTPTGVPGEVKVFKRDGKAEASLGRHGSGPGEFLDPRRVFIGPGDSIHVLDWDSRRYSIFSSTREFVRSYVMAYHPPWSVIFLGNGETVQQIDSRGPEDIGFPLHIVRSNGDIRKSFGADPPIADPADPNSRLRRMATAGSGRFWTTRLDEYALELWDTSGTLVKRFTRQPQWFKAWQGPVQGTTMGGIRVDNEGGVWTLIALFDPTASSRPRTLAEVSSTRQQRETIIEVVDVEHGRVLSSRRFPMTLSGFVDDLVSSRRELPDGTVVLDVFRVKLLRQ